MSRGRLQLAAYLLVVGMFAYGLWVVVDLQGDLRAEIDSDAAEACERALETRVEQRDGLLEIVHQLGGRQETIDTIHEVYDGLPDPASCETGRGEP